MPWCLFVVMTLAWGPALAVQDPAVAAPTPRTRAETLALVARDIATREKVAVEQVRVLEQHDRTWEDEDLGCPARKGLREPRPVPGYAFIVEVGERRFEYHADRMGRIKRCPPAKPRSPAGR